MDTFNLARQPFNSELGPFFLYFFNASKRNVCKSLANANCSDKGAGPPLLYRPTQPTARLWSAQCPALSARPAGSKPAVAAGCQRPGLLPLAGAMKGKEKWFKNSVKYRFYSNKTMRKSKLRHEGLMQTN